jgi:hypothetical protein
MPSPFPMGDVLSIALSIAYTPAGTFFALLESDPEHRDELIGGYPSMMIEDRPITPSLVRI